jgi:citrate synthase
MTTKLSYERQKSFWLFDEMNRRVPRIRRELSAMLAEHKDAVLGKSTLNSLLGGGRAVPLSWEWTTDVTATVGMRVHGRGIRGLTHLSPEDMIGLSYLGDYPTKDESILMQTEFARRAKNYPAHMWDTIRALPREMHPMRKFSMLLGQLGNESIFAKDYNSGNLSKLDYWKPYFHDSFNLIPWATITAAAVFVSCYGDPDLLQAENFRYDGKQGMAANLANFLHISNGCHEKLTAILGLFLILHFSHGGGNASQHTAKLVSSTLTDIFGSVSAGMMALFGPLHGRANSDALKMIKKLIKKSKGIPTAGEIANFIRELVKKGHVLSGFGHAVLRVTDTRFLAQIEIGGQYCRDSELFQTALAIYEYAPEILKKEKPNIKNPYPNVDLGSCTLLYDSGIEESDFYVVLFGLSRIIGMCTSTTMDRAMCLGIERPGARTLAQLYEELYRAEA